MKGRIFGPRCVCGSELMLVTTNHSETVEMVRPDPLVTVKRNYRCGTCHGEVTFTHHSGDDPGNLTHPSVVDQF